MDLFGQILGQVLEGAARPAAAPKAPQTAPRRPAPSGEATGMPSPGDLGDILTQIFGNGGAKLPDVVRDFEAKGMREQVDSWVKTGPNQPLDRRQIEDIFGGPRVDDMARSRGIDREQLAEVLARYIPKIIDELTPGGRLPGGR